MKAPAAVETLREVLSLETARGFRDNAVAGGLAPFAERLLREAEKSGTLKRSPAPLLAALGNYRRLSHAERRQLVEKLQSALERAYSAYFAEVALATKAERTARRKPPLAAGPDTPVGALSGVGPKRALLLKAAGIETLADLLRFFPRRHEDRRHFQPVSQLEDGQRSCLKVAVRGGGRLHRRPGLSIVYVPAGDDTGTLQLVWFNQQYMVGRFRPSQEVVVSGRVRRQGRQTTLTVEECEPVLPGQAPLQVGRIVPIYPLARGLEGVGQTALRRWIWEALRACSEALPDQLPAQMRERRCLLGRFEALQDMHFPPDFAALEKARRRLAFEELLALQLSFLRRARDSRETTAPTIRNGLKAALQLSRRLPFALTGAQERALGEICRDMASGRPMNRLLQGDVGSGKTVVAALAAYAAAGNGYQVAFMAPTEVLAAQHLRVLSDLLSLGKVEVGLLIGSLEEQEKRRIRSRLEHGEAMAVVGTHALIQESVSFRRLGLAIIDEQHRFGVSQRALLRRKGALRDGGACHVLVMTATPIPRTLTLAFYGDLDVSLIDEMPAGRRPVRTSLASRADAHLHLADHLAAGGQAYVVCPAIEALQPSGGESRVGGSRVLGPGLLDPRLSDPRLPSGSEAGPEQALPWFGEEPSGKRELTSVVALAEELKKGPLRPYQVEMLHGQMSREEKEEILSGFREGKIQALVATTVIEVGVDVPSATLMVVEDAERFGLAQLHQLRGRVGRGEAASTCLLVVNSTSPETAERLRVLLDTNDGFRIAEEDLRLRGPGEFYGLRQHGLPELGAANLLTDLDILIEARQEADGLLARDPTLARPEHFLLRAATEGRPALLDRA